MSQDQKSRIIRNAIKLAAIIVLAVLIWRLYDQNDAPGSSSNDSQVQQSDQAGSQDDHTTAGGTSLDAPDENQKTEAIYTFRNKYLLDEHFEKHGDEFDYDSASEYENGASAVVNNPNALHKIEKDDGDDIYYLERTNELVIVSTDGYIRTYFRPDSGIKYYNKQ